MSGPARILVLDGHSAAALAFTRSLGRAGHWVAVGAQKGTFAAASLSRYCKQSFEYPASTANASAFVAAVLQFVGDNKVDLIVPATDWTTAPLSLAREQFAGTCRLVLPTQVSLELCSDKYETIQLARSLDVPVPDTWLVRALRDIEVLPALQFPVVVKDRYSARWAGNKAVLGGVQYVYSAADLRKKIEARLKDAGDVLVQSFTPGVGVGFSCFAVQGEIRLPFQWERIREVDPRGSGSSARKSVKLDPTVAEASLKLVLQAGFEGIAMVEFKRRPEGDLTLMEINGRPWGSIGLPIACGIDYPVHLANWYLEGMLPPVKLNYRDGTNCRRAVGELEHLANLRRGTPPKWPIAYPSFWGSAVRMAVPWWPGMCYDDVWLSDPRPGLAGISNWLRHRTRKKH